jgi:hypothetical protein
LSDESQRDREAYGTDFSEVRHEPREIKWRLRAYVAALVLFPFVLVIGTLTWMASGSYARHAQYPYLADTGYGMRLRGADCQVLIDGDSTALVGVLPSVIAQRTGLTTCNISEVAGVQVVNGMMVLDTYLKHDRRPEFLVFLYAPENLNDARRWTNVSTFEGYFFRLKYGRDEGLAKMMLHDPNEIITDAELGFRTGVQWLFSRPLPAAKLHERELSGGHIAEPGATMTHCAADDVRRAPDAAWIEHLRRTYGVEGTRVLIDVTPVPPCDPTLAFYNTMLAPNTVDNGLGTLPLGMYTTTGRLHTNAAGAQAISVQIAEQIARDRDGLPTEQAPPTPIPTPRQNPGPTWGAR